MWDPKWFLEPEKEEELIEKIAEATIKWGMEAPAVLMLETIRPVSRIGAKLGIITVSPWIVMVSDFIGKESWGLRGMNFMIMLRNRDNVEKLIQCIEVKAEEAKIKEKKLKEEMRNSSEPRERNRILSKLKKFFRL